MLHWAIYDIRAQTIIMMLLGTKAVTHSKSALATSSLTQLVSSPADSFSWEGHCGLMESWRQLSLKLLLLQCLSLPFPHHFCSEEHIMEPFRV
jgi:hypothetical protein